MTHFAYYATVKDNFSNEIDQQYLMKNSDPGYDWLVNAVTGNQQWFTVMRVSEFHAQINHEYYE